MVYFLFRLRWLQMMCLHQSARYQHVSFLHWKELFSHITGSNFYTVHIFGDLNTLHSVERGTRPRVLLSQKKLELCYMCHRLHRYICRTYTSLNCHTPLNILLQHELKITNTITFQMDLLKMLNKMELNTSFLCSVLLLFIIRNTGANCPKGIMDEVNIPSNV